MPRGPQHSSNWGGRRKGQGAKPGCNNGGGRKVGGVNRMTARAIEIAESAQLHPMEYLMHVINDPDATTRDRLFASSAALPYCLSRKATEVIVHNELEQKSENELELHLVSVRQEMKQLGMDVLEGEVVGRD